MKEGKTMERIFAILMSAGMAVLLAVYGGSFATKFGNMNYFWLSLPVAFVVLIVVLITLQKK